MIYNKIHRSIENIRRFGDQDLRGRDRKDEADSTGRRSTGYERTVGRDFAGRTV